MRNEESKLQQACVRWFRIQYPAYSRRLWAVPNGGARNEITGAILKAEGAMRGVPDLFLSLPRGGYSGCFFEMKTAKGKVSDHQKAFMAEHEKDYKCVVCRSLDDFMREVTQYLNG